jgi:hypothetical protein
VVVCAIALSLAYPVREYIAQRRQIDQLFAEQHQIVAQLSRLKGLQAKISSPAYIEQQAEDKLHLCPPADRCYTVIPGTGKAPASHPAVSRVSATPWYQRLWTSVQQADTQQSDAQQSDGQQSGGQQPGAKQPGGKQSGGKQSGGKQSGGKQSGGKQSGRTPAH